MSEAPTISAKPTTDEQDQMRRFVRLTHDMRDSRYIQDISKNPRSMSAKFDDDGEGVFDKPTYDWEDCCSFLTMFRKVALAKKEPVYLTKILNIVMRCSDDEVRDIWRDTARRIKAMLEHRYSAIQYSVGTSEGRKRFTGSQVLEILVNGRIFHESQDKVIELSMLDQVEIGCHIFMLNIEIIMPVLNCCINLRNLMYRLSLLPDSDFPPPDPKAAGE